MGEQPADLRQLFRSAADHAAGYRATFGERPVRAAKSAAEVRADFQRPLAQAGRAADEVIEELVALADGGLVASAGPRYFGFVTGGALPAASAADMLAVGWDQNAGNSVMSPTSMAAEQAAGGWLKDLLGIPPAASAGFVTGAQAANTVGLAAARHHVLGRAGWDVERDGLIGAPRVHVLCGEDEHVTVYAALRLLGLGEAGAVRVAGDEQGRMRPDALREALAELDDGPTIVCAQAGNVATGASDPFDEIADACEERGAWLHVDGAFGLWARVSPSLGEATRGVERADSWGLDAHKWLNVPYDSALAIVADEHAHRAAMGLTAAYLVATPTERDNTNYVPESSRRARGVPMYAALRSLGRAGVAELVERNCAQARLMASLLFERIPGAEIVNDVVLNQVLLRLPGGDEANRAAVARIQRDGTCWLGGTEWRGRAVIRIAISNWSTTDADIERSAAAIAAAAGAP